ncbi:MAG: hypothetical protein IKT40_12785 [Bacilli bacterium]|nr:hypothetical protein [Bacilli bacterium]
MIDKITKSVVVNYAKSVLENLENDNLLSANAVLNELTRIVNYEFKKQYCSHIETIQFEEKEYIKPFIATLKNKGAIEVKPVGEIVNDMADTFQIKMYDVHNSDLKDFIYKDLQGKQII